MLIFIPVILNLTNFRRALVNWEFYIFAENFLSLKQTISFMRFELEFRFVFNIRKRIFEAMKLTFETSH